MYEIILCTFCSFSIDKCWIFLYTTNHITTIQNNKTIYCVHSKHELIHSNELAQLTGKTDRQVELANHKKVGQILPSNRLPRSAKALRLLRRCVRLCFEILKLPQNLASDKVPNNCKLWENRNSCPKTENTVRDTEAGRFWQCLFYSHIP